MNFSIIQPNQHLADYVKFFWVAETTSRLYKPFVHHAFAYPCAELIFCYKGQFKYKYEFDAERVLASGIYGQTQSFSKVTSGSHFGFFGIYLYPHTFPQLFRMPAKEFTNQYADIKMLCGKEGEILEERIMLASSTKERIKLVSDFLETRLKNIRTGYANLLSSIKAISDSHHTTSVKTLADNNFLSVRQFERRFKDFSGFSPKLFLRITRFNSILNKNFQNKSLTQIAYEFGYYDQSHFIHDFQKFSGHNPKEYFKEETIAATNRGTVEFSK